MKQTSILAACCFLGALLCLAQDGKQIYADKCSTCHGADGAAKTARAKQLKVRSAKDSNAKMNAAEMVKAVENGKGLDMPGYAKQLTGGQIQGVVEYFRGLGK